VDVAVLAVARRLEVDVLPAGAEKFLWSEAAVDEGGGDVA
jgi:hypothetical protein